MSASFGKNGKNPEYCIKCKPKEYTYVGKKCKIDRCNNMAYWCKNKDAPREYCHNHAPKYYVNYNVKKCISCELYHFRKKKKKCQYCDPAKYMKTREIRMKNFLDGNDYKYISHDSITSDNYSICGKYRPDFVFDCNTHFIVLECDEDQHSQYDNSCEKIRMCMIAQGLGLPTHFIRFNPDKYMVKHSVIRISFKKRIIECMKLYKKLQNILPDDDINVIYLYYNDMHLRKKSHNIINEIKQNII